MAAESGSAAKTARRREASVGQAVFTLENLIAFYHRKCTLSGAALSGISHDSAFDTTFSEIMRSPSSRRCMKSTNTAPNERRQRLGLLDGQGRASHRSSFPHHLAAR